MQLNEVGMMLLGGPVAVVHWSAVAHCRGWNVPKSDQFASVTKSFER
jgi:hypothetical protein